MQTKKDTQSSRRLASITKLYTPSQKPAFAISPKTQTGPELGKVTTFNYAEIIKQDLMKSLGLTFLFIVLQYILYFSYFRYL